MNSINIKNICNNPKKIELYKDAVIYEDNINNKYVIKNNNDDILKLYNYLNSRGFDYLPRLTYCNNDIYAYEYLNDTMMPDEQRASDLIKLDALLHNKTVYYKDVSVDELKQVYDDISDKIDNVYKYYDDIINHIESEIYMSPSNYLLARNCSSIFNSLSFSKNELENWYEMMKKISKKRVVLLHNNLNVNHLIKSDKNTLISWNHHLRGLPIYDFLNFYKKDHNKYDFNELYNIYINKFPLLKEEKILLFILLYIPDKITFTNNELENTINVTNLFNYLFGVDKLFMKNEAKNTKEQNNNVNKE